MYDVPSSVGDYMIRDVGVSGAAWGVISSLYSLPNMVIPLFAGIIVDNVGMCKSYVFFYFLVACGAAIFSLGASAPANLTPTTSFITMFIGRLMFALGGETGLIANDVMLAAILPPSLSTSGVTLSVMNGRVGSIVAMNLLPRAVERLGLSPAMYISLTVPPPFMLIVIAAACLAWVVLQRKVLPNLTASTYPLQTTEIDPTQTPTPPVDVEHGDSSFIPSPTQPYLSVETPAMSDISSGSGSDTSDTPTASPRPNPTPTPHPLSRLAAALSVPGPGIVLACSGILAMGILGYGWPSVGQVLLTTRDPTMAPDSASTLVSIVNMMALLSPLWAALIDRYHRQPLLLMVGSALSATAFILLLLRPDLSPAGPMVLQGLAFSLFSPCCWGSVPMVVPANKIGTTFGLASSLLNVGQAIASFVALAVVKASWHLAIGLFAVAAAGSLIYSIFFYIYDDTVLGGRLKQSGQAWRERAAFMGRIEAMESEIRRLGGSNKHDE